MLNRHDKQAHDLIDNPIFPVDKDPPVIRTWEDLIAATPPPVARIIDKVQMFCEDNAIWPVSLNADPDLDDRQMSRKDHFEEGFQYAKAAATREAMGNPFLTAWSVVAMTVFALASVLIALFFIQMKFGDTISQQVGHIPGFIALFGALAVVQGPSEAERTLKTALRAI